MLSGIRTRCSNSFNSFNPPGAPVEGVITAVDVSWEPARPFRFAKNKSGRERRVPEGRLPTFSYRRLPRRLRVDGDSGSWQMSRGKETIGLSWRGKKIDKGLLYTSGEMKKKLVCNFFTQLHNRALYQTFSSENWKITISIIGICRLF